MSETARKAALEVLELLAALYGAQAVVLTLDYSDETARFSRPLTRQSMSVTASALESVREPASIVSAIESYWNRGETHRTEEV